MTLDPATASLQRDLKLTNMGDADSIVQPQLTRGQAKLPFLIVR